jgi:tRNA(adenine34) deaminase
MDKLYFMREALKQAKKAYDEGEVPVGAVIVRNGIILARGRNKREKNKNSLHHAELLAIDKACKRLGGWRLFDCEMYVTLEPCPMCAGAIINSRIKKVFIGALDEKSGAVSSVISLFDLPFNHKPEIEMGLLQEESKKMLSDFFKELRKCKTLLMK